MSAGPRLVALVVTFDRLAQLQVTVTRLLAEAVEAVLVVPTTAPLITQPIATMASLVRIAMAVALPAPLVAALLFCEHKM